MNIDENRMYIAYLDNPRLYGTGNAIQHLHYLPFGEDWVDQRNSTWNAPYTFSGKEKDAETGYGYFGARYYDSGLSIWLSVDPMSDKYPSMSPYNYCANNPIILVDPDGREVEYNSFSDIVIVAIALLTNSDFRNNFKELKKSEETYVFNGKYEPNSDGGKFTTDGNKLFINYKRGRNEKEGTNTFTNLRHETEHAVQFEYGEIGFEYSSSGYGILDIDGIFYDHVIWNPVNYDLDDELKARFSGYCGFIWDPKKDNSRNWWLQDNSDTFSNEDRYQALRDRGYSGETPVNNTNTERIKTNSEYKLPYRARTN